VEQSRHQPGTNATLEVTATTTVTFDPATLLD